MTEFKNSSATPSYINFNIDEQETQLQDKIAAVKKLFDDFPNFLCKNITILDTPWQPNRVPK